jgi:hypothetical protein
MDPVSPAAQDEIQFVLSLLRIGTPGQPVTKQTEAIEQLLSVTPNR